MSVGGRHCRSVVSDSTENNENNCYWDLYLFLFMFSLKNYPFATFQKSLYSLNKASILLFLIRRVKDVPYRPFNLIKMITSILTLEKHLEDLQISLVGFVGSNSILALLKESANIHK